MSDFAQDFDEGAYCPQGGVEAGSKNAAIVAVHFGKRLGIRCVLFRGYFAFLLLAGLITAPPDVAFLFVRQ
jgi:hypothetical protein